MHKIWHKRMLQFTKKIITNGNLKDNKFIKDKGKNEDTLYQIIKIKKS